MSSNEIQSMLNTALEVEIPSSTVDLWPAVKANLVAGNLRSNQQGDHMNPTRSRRIPRFALALALALALLGFVIATPQGRSFAQSIVEFFTQAKSTTFPVEESQIALEEADETSPTALPPGPLISVAEANEQVGFAVAELPDVPQGFETLGARLSGNTVSIEYQAQGGGGNLIITQSQEGFTESDWSKVPAQAIVPVKIGESDGEFAQGMFVVYPDATSATWNADAPVLRLRWAKDGTWFEIAKYGDVQVMEYLDMAGLIDLAESLAVQP